MFCFFVCFVYLGFFYSFFLIWVRILKRFLCCNHLLYICLNICLTIFSSKFLLLLLYPLWFVEEITSLYCDISHSLEFASNCHLLQVLPLSPPFPVDRWLQQETWSDPDLGFFLAGQREGCSQWQHCGSLALWLEIGFSLCFFSICSVHSNVLMFCSHVSLILVEFNASTCQFIADDQTSCYDQVISKFFRQTSWFHCVACDLAFLWVHLVLHKNILH